jgi:hypothetical protein
MKNVIVGTHHTAGKPVSTSAFACSAATFSASIAAIMLSISFGLNWPEYLMLTLTAGALAFGVAFTIFEMRRLTGKRR